VIGVNHVAARVGTPSNVAPLIAAMRPAECSCPGGGLSTIQKVAEPRPDVVTIMGGPVFPR